MSLQQRTISVIYSLGFGAVLIGGVVVLPSFWAEPVAVAEANRYGSMVVEAPHLLKVSGVHLEPSGVGTFYFTINIPASYGKSLEAIRISQIPSGHRLLSFDANQSKVVLGQRFLAKNEDVALSAIGGSDDEQRGALTLAFAKPLLPGTTFTVAVEVERNPISGGIYQFGVTAYPVGDGTSGLYLGTGRVNFDEK